MSRRLISLLGLCCLYLFVAGTFVSCGTARQTVAVSGTDAVRTTPDLLSPEERRKFDYFFLEAVRLKEKGDLDAAFEMFSHCLEIDSRSAVTLYELSKYYMYLGLPQKGEEALKEAVRLVPGNYWYKETLAAYYQNKGENEKAIEVIEDMTVQFPSRLEPLLALVDLYSRTKNYEAVINTLNRLELLDGKSEQISMEKFRMYLAMDNNERAFQEIESLAKEYPYEMRYLTILGDVYLENGKEEEAYATYQKVLAEDADYAPAMLSLASYYEKKGLDSLYHVQLDSVLLNTKVESDTKLNVMRQLIMRSERADRDSTKIIALFDSMLAKEQENADIAMLAAQYMLSKRMDESAKKVLHQIVDIDPGNKPARLQLLSFAISRNDLDEVVRICIPAVEYMPEALEFHYYLGVAYYQKEEVDKALDTFVKGVRQITPESDKTLASDFYSIMGDLYHKKKMDAQAYAAYDSALVYKPDNIAALNNYAYYLSVERKDLDKAEEMSYRTVKAEPSNGTYLDTYAWILFEKGKYAEARIYIDQAMKHDGDKSSVVVEHCGDIYYKTGEPDKAVEFWKQAEKLAGEPVEEGSDPRTPQELKLLKKKIEHKKYFEK